MAVHVSWPSHFSESLILVDMNVAQCKVWCILTANLTSRMCVAFTRIRGLGLETCPKAMHFWKSGLKFAFGRSEKGKVFGIRS